MSSLGIYSGASKVDKAVRDPGIGMSGKSICYPLARRDDSVVIWSPGLCAADQFPFGSDGRGRELTSTDTAKVKLSLFEIRSETEGSRIYLCCRRYSYFK